MFQEGLEEKDGGTAQRIREDHHRSRSEEVSEVRTQRGSSPGGLVRENVPGWKQVYVCVG